MIRKLKKVHGWSKQPNHGINFKRPKDDINEQSNIDNSSILVSVLMTVYNCEDLVERAINSVLNQTHKNLELLIIDDASTDGSYLKIKKFESDQRVKIFRNEKNQGTYRSKNYLIRNSIGSFITTIDSDDFDYPSKIEKQLKAFYENPVIKLVTCDYLRTGSSKTFGFSCAMWKREVFDKIGFFDSVRFGADSEFFDRFYICYGIESRFHIREILQEGPRRPEGITSLIPENSQERKKYVEDYKKRHQESSDLYVDFDKKNYIDCQKLDYYKYIYIIPSYNRYDRALETINTIKSFNQNNLIILINDGSDDLRYENFQNINDLIYIKNSENKGKSGYWETVNKLLFEMKKYRFEFGVMLPDDMIFIDNFDVKILKYRSKNKILSLFRQERVITNWGYLDWIDGAFCAPYKFFEDLDFNLLPISISRESTSSGVGKQMTIRLNSKKWEVKFYGSFLIHNESNLSVMHPELRKKEPLFTSNINTEEIAVCGLATIESRKSALKLTISSILPQVDKLIVYQNGYKETLDFLENEKIEVISSLDTNIDKGDAGKFYKVQEIKNCYYFSIDDDLIYPNNYVEYMIESSKKYDNKKIVTLHGRNFPGFPISSYYRTKGEKLHCLGDVKTDNEVQFGGTGVMCIHSSLVNFSFYDFLYANMADIWIGKFSKESGTKIICVSHKKDFLSYIKPEFTVYDNSVNSDKIQTELVNKIYS